MAFNYNDLKDKYQELLDTVEVKDSWKQAIAAKARMIYANRDRYKAISTTIPWQFIGVIHSLESGLDFNTHLHNGDPLSARTRLVPRGRPIEGKPPFTWEESAVDALTMKGYDKVTDWSMAHQCFLLEKYNGAGYYNRKKNSPYLWSGTNHYTIGKYIRDGKYSPTAVSQQIGCIPLLLELQKLESVTIKDLAPVSRKLSILQRIRFFFGTTVVGWFSAENLPVAHQVLGTVKEFAVDNAALLIIGGIGTTWIICKYLEALHVEDFKNGNYTPSRMKEDEDV